MDFYTNYAKVLKALSRTPDATARDMSIRLGITERAVRDVLDGLIAESYIRVKKVGRNNKYTILKSMPSVGEPQNLSTGLHDALAKITKKGEEK